MIIIETKEIIEEVIIVDYPSSIKIANKIAPKYFVLPNSKKRGKKVLSVSHLPKKYQDLEKFKFDTNGILINLETGTKVISNPIKNGQERWWVVNFQDIWNQTIVKEVRASRVEKLKNIFKPYLQKIKPLEDKVFPIELNLFIYDHKMPVDISNKGVIYIKVIEDSLKELGIIPDDKVTYIECSGRTKFIKIDEDRKPKMVIRLLKHIETEKKTEI
jgi:hypothetical protein